MPTPLGATRLRRRFASHKSQVTVQVHCYRSAVQYPFQVYGSQSSSYWYLFTSFQVLGTCLIATGAAQDSHLTFHFGVILVPCLSILVAWPPAKQCSCCSGSAL